MTDRDRSNDSWREEDRDKRRGEVLLYFVSDSTPAADKLEELMAFAQPRGWRWISIAIKDPEYEVPAKHAEEFVAALDKLIEQATRAKEECLGIEFFEDGDEAPWYGDIRDAAEDAEREWDKFVSLIDKEADDAQD